MPEGREREKRGIMSCTDETGLRKSLVMHSSLFQRKGIRLQHKRGKALSLSPPPSFLVSSVSFVFPKPGSRGLL
ncbi:hypothetical protein KFK09_005665 [Dendrobium nobile]|uniref:Uncharacterized protein n=1 Tax=Dendrobium nobile TaxID=94219 RepID=A0A8T3BWA5_DENNO|nr:hypothetical protein KFK09_005665 [Dendrobium nobile]